MRIAVLIVLTVAMLSSGCAISPPYKGHVHVSVNPATGFR